MFKVAALNLIEYLIFSCGFEEKSIRKNYRFVTDKRKNQINVSDMVIFSDFNRSDISTSCISVNWVEDENNFEDYLNMNKFLVTPLIILPSPEKVRIYDLRSEGMLTSDVSYDLLEKHFSINRIKYSKTSLYKAKNSDKFQQLSLFALEATKDLLVKHFESAVRNELSRLDDKFYSDIVKVSMHVLAACIIEDKLWVEKANTL
jgi:hypothetical protein